MRAMCGVQLKVRKRSEDLILNEAIDQLAMANSVHWYGHVMMREVGHVLRRVSDFEVKVNGRRGR